MTICDRAATSNGTGGDETPAAGALLRHPAEGKDVAVPPQPGTAGLSLGRGRAGALHLRAAGTSYVLAGGWRAPVGRREPDPALRPGRAPAPVPSSLPRQRRDPRPEPLPPPARRRHVGAARPCGPAAAAAAAVAGVVRAPASATANRRRAAPLRANLGLAGRPAAAHLV